jgi:glycosyltransferase involved in cell wall biosynthesis
MKVAIDSGPLTGGDSVRGVGVYTQNLVKELVKLRDIKVDLVDFRIADFENYDVIHYPYFKLFFTKLPIIKSSKVVVTIHDLIPLIYPKHYPPGIKGTFKLGFQKLMLKNVDTVITVSETSKKDIVRFLDIPEENIKVIYEAPREIFNKVIDKTILEKVRQKYQLPEKFVLYVGDVNYNKNLSTLAEACVGIKMSLVIVGKQARSKKINLNHIENRSFKLFLDKYGENKLIYRLGFVDDDDLVKLYGLASVYCQPSFYEGFGLPVLEAMACGTPVVISKTQALVEIAGNAALIADPKNPDDLGIKIQKIMNKKTISAELVEQGIEHIQGFSWKKCADETLEVYRHVVNSRK